MVINDLPALMISRARLEGTWVGIGLRVKPDGQQGLSGVSRQSVWDIVK
jgi:hypothetical protein